jgi:RluA family pseudouridine synthase
MPVMPKTLLDHLLQLYPNAKRTTLRRMIEAGRIRINGQRARTLKQPIDDKDVIKTLEHSKKASPRFPLPIIFEDEDLLVIDKPAGLLTSTIAGEKRPTALAMVRQYVAGQSEKSQVGLIHRLDRDASGLLVFSKNHQAYLSLKRQFFEHSVDRIYLAVVHGVPNPRSGMIDSRLVERADGSVHSTTDSRRGERAVTYFETVESTKTNALLRVRLQTGKKHQIRAHLSERDVPIVNDRVYCDQKHAGRLLLAATELALTHPRTQKRMTFELKPPAELSLVRNKT